MTTDEQRIGYMLAGLPGAGKSAAATAGSDITGGGVISAGDMIREMARRDGLEDPTSDELGNYAKDMRHDEGPGFFAEKATGLIHRGEINAEYPVWIDSVRHIHGVREFRKFFDTSFLIYIDTTFEERLKRVRSRGREGEANWDAADLMQRDERELKHLGTQTILDSGEIDYAIPNDGSVVDLRNSLERIVSI